MKFRSRKDARDLSIDLAPLIDVVFILLIFFMVTTTFDRSSELRIDLPEASATAAKQDMADTLEIAIDSKGQFYLNQVKVNGTSRKTLYLALSKVVGDNKKVPVVLKADAMTPHQAVITAMDAAGRLGLSRLSIATNIATQ